MTVPSMPSVLTGREYLRVGGGYGSAAAGDSPAGGLDVDHAGHIAADGDLTLGGDLRLGGQVESTLTFNGELRRGSAGCDKTWFTMLRPGAGIEAATAGPATVYNVNAHQKLVAIPFDHSAQENAAVNFALPPDYDGSTLRATFYWTCAGAGLSGNALWKLYGPNAAAGDGDSLNQTVSVDTGLQCQSLDAYHSQWALQIAFATFSVSDADDGFFAGSIVRAVDSGPFSADGLLLGIRIDYE